MTFDFSKYRTGYSFAVGGVVLCNHKVLLVKRASGERKGDWALPGGMVEQNETIHSAVQREVLEETGAKAKVEGLIAVLNRVLNDENNTYFIFKMRVDDESTQADGSEVSDARFFTLDELKDLPCLQSLTWLITTSALQDTATSLPFFLHPRITSNKGILYAGEGIREDHKKLVRSLQDDQVNDKLNS